MKTVCRIPLVWPALLLLIAGCSDSAPSNTTAESNPNPFASDAGSDRTDRAQSSRASDRGKNRKRGKVGRKRDDSVAKKQRNRRADAGKDSQAKSETKQPRGEKSQPADAWIGKPAPAFEVPLLGGGSFELGGASNPQATILAFWATYDKASHVLLPQLKQVAAGFSGQGVRLVAVNDRERHAEIKEFLDEHQLEVPVAFDLDGNLASQFQLKVLPAIFVIDRQGNVQNVYRQVRTTIGRDLRKDLRKLVEAADVAAAPDTTTVSSSDDPGSGLAIWDTVLPSENRLGAETVIARSGWRRVPRSAKPPAFDGDAVIHNDRLLAVFRKQDPSVDVFALAGPDTQLRTTLRVVGPSGQLADKLTELSVVENTRGAIGLQATYQTQGGNAATLKFRIKRGEVLLQTEPQAGAEKLQVSCPGRFVVLPDFFADDIVIDAQKIPASQIEIPSENILMHLTGGGNSIAMCVFENSNQDVKVTLEEQDGQRRVAGSVIDYGEGKKIWLALLEAPQVWHSFDVAEEDANKVKQLKWTMPFTAQWRTNFTRVKKDLTDSWEMLLQKPGAKDFVKPSWLGSDEDRVGENRRRWTTVLDHFPYPCWTNEFGSGFIQPLRRKALTFRGPAVIYPINRVEKTPTDAFTVIDVMRSSLGVGPCEYILQVESQTQEMKGRATCSARSALKKIYASRQQRARQKEIEQALDDALDFVTHIRHRIDEYIAFGREMRQYLAEQKTAHPELDEYLTEMDEITAELDERMEARRLEIRSPSFVAGMNEEFRESLMGYTGRDALVRLRRYTSRLTDIGGSQDELVGECRWIVRRLRQRAGILMATNPEFAEVAKEIRARTQKVLLKPAEYEGVRH